MAPLSLLLDAVVDCTLSFLLLGKASKGSSSRGKEQEQEQEQARSVVPRTGLEGNELFSYFPRTLLPNLLDTLAHGT